MRLYTPVLVLVLAAAAIVTVSAGQTSSPEPKPSYMLSNAPAPLQPAAQRAQQAFAKFQATLIQRMNDELARGGPAAALSVYRDEAARLTANLGREYNMRIGRTSHRLRNAHNVPPQWAAPYVKESLAADAKAAPTWVVDMGPIVGVIAPLETREACTLCHGPQDKLPPAIVNAIRASYPGDRATGFSAGQVRGWIWAEVPQR
jgi:Protein of unknown function (DUF3365)